MDPFASKHFTKFDHLITANDRSWHGFKLDSELQSEVLHLARIKDVAIPDLKADVLTLRLGDDSLEQIDLVETGSGTRSPTCDKKTNVVKPEPDDDDIWDGSVVSRTAPIHGLLSWDRFERRDQPTPELNYLSEAKPEVYDAVWDSVWKADRGPHLKFARVDQFYHALKNLLVGRSSSFFRWDTSSAKFELMVEECSLSGHSPALTGALCNTLCKCATSFRKVKVFADSHKESYPTLVALQTAVAQILHAIERHSLREEDQTTMSTFVKLRTTATSYVELLEVLENLADVASSAENETGCLTRCINLIEDHWNSQVHLRSVLSQLATQMLAPALRTTSEQLGLRHPQSVNGLLSGWVLSELLPMLGDDFIETMECLSTMRQHTPSSVWVSNTTRHIRFVQAWHELVDLQNEADELERDSISRLSNEKTASRSTVPHLSTSLSTSTFNVDSLQTDPFQADFSLFARPTTDTCLASQLQHNPIQDLTFAFLDHDETTAQPDLLPVQALELSLAPFLAFQLRISSYALMRVLFLQHDLLAHLELLHSFQLLGNGTFATRLSSALFDAGQYNAESHRKTGLTAGLRLEDREVWPPASSELRLVLMGLLTETTSRGRQETVLECISFAIRDLPDEELELCRNVHSTHALDFLRLVYVPSNPVLELVITPTALEKYDPIFKFLLVLLRVHTLYQNLVAKLVCHQPTTRPSVAYQRFCIDFHHFVSKLMDFMLHEAIELPWSRFMKHVQEVRRYLSDQRYEESMRLAGSIAQLRKMHEDCLDEMLTTSFLKRRQAKLYDGLCGILTLSLQFASTATRESHDGQTLQLYKDFKQRLTAWLSQVEETTRKTQDAALQRLEILQLKLDMSSYYDDSTT
ncbi:hypothetical protein PMZ80_005937 [Knufia obscura]|uniref:Spindle pole body component n=1 Tax=Knufia obscura TaxID=1635080 RepID=A0ABR0RMZ8_9EURO|nr:hypothetical protein PMZ80_005937 [Knufia obscura]